VSSRFLIPRRAILATEPTRGVTADVVLLETVLFN
jgi:hypothetical protein